MTRIEDGVTTALKESQAISERINGIDAKLKASQVTAEWSQEQIRAMQVRLTICAHAQFRCILFRFISGTDCRSGTIGRAARSTHAPIWPNRIANAARCSIQGSVASSSTTVTSELEAIQGERRCFGMCLECAIDNIPYSK
jgi:hypothetical protein